MILNERINKILKLILEIDEEFKKEYIRFVNRLPQEIIKTCQSSKEYLGYVNSSNDYYDHSYNIEEDRSELQVELESYDEYSLLASNIFIKNLLEAPIESQHEETNTIWNFATFTYTNCLGYRMEFSFTLKRISKDTFVITMHKYTADLS